MAVRFKIEHIALQPRDPARAHELLKALGLDEWSRDVMTTFGRTWLTEDQLASVDLDFNYQADCERTYPDGKRRPLELEIMNKCSGPNWMDDYVERDKDFVSHFGMQATIEQLDEFKAIFAAQNVRIAQEVVTIDHANDHVRKSRRYKKVIWDTRQILGVDLEVNVLLPLEPAE